MALKILVKAPNWVGDCILATPAIAFLRAQFPDAAILVMARPVLCSLFENNPNASGTIPFDDKNPDAQALAGIRATKFDAAVIMPNSIRSAWYTKKLDIPIRVGFKRNFRGILLTHALPYDPFEWRSPVSVKRSSQSIMRGRLTRWPLGRPPRHMVQYYMDLAQATVHALGKPEAKAPACHSRGIPNLVLPIGPDARKHVESLIVHAGLSGKQLIGIGPSAAGGTAKCRDNAAQAQLLKRLAAEFPDYEFVSTAIAPEAAAADELECAMDGVKLHRLGEQCDLPAIIALIDRFRLYIANDSGSMHIAAARQVPIVAAFGPTDWNVTYPWTHIAEVVRVPTECAPCLHKDCPIDHRCMSSITNDMMFEACENLLKRRTSSDTAGFKWGTDSVIAKRKALGL